MKRTSTFDVIFDAANTILMILIVIVMIYPFWYVLCYSFSETWRVTGGMLLFPQGFSTDSFRVCLSNPDILNGLFISVARTVVGSGLMVIVSSMAAYALSKNDLIGIKGLRMFFLFTMYFSGSPLIWSLRHCR